MRAMPCAAGVLLGLGLWVSAAAQGTYHPIASSRQGEAITLTGHDLNVEQVVAIAREGARIELSADAKQRQADAYGLLLEGSADEVRGDERVREAYLGGAAA